MNEYSLRIIPDRADIDELGHVNNAVWVRWLQEVGAVKLNGDLVQITSEGRDHATLLLALF